MEVRNCKQCGRLFNYVGGVYKNLCPGCIKKLEDKFGDVKHYIEENKDATINQIAEDCDVTVKQIKQWVREERLQFSADSPVGIECENCGTMIKSGRFCDTCKLNMMNTLDSAYGKSKAVASVKRKDGSAKMRFIDK